MRRPRRLGQKQTGVRPFTAPLKSTEEAIRSIVCRGGTTTKFNVYVDGTWLFKQCDGYGILAARTETPDSPTRIDFNKLLTVLRHRASEFVPGEQIEQGNLFFCTSIFSVGTDVEGEDPDALARLQNNVFAREQFAGSAVEAGFPSDGILRVPLRRWTLRRLREGRYHEKQVDTWVVAQLVEQAIHNPDFLHFVVSGDIDMMPGVRKVVPDITEKVVMVATHPLQFNPDEQQTSFAIESFGFRYGPIHLEDELEHIIAGEHVYRCRNHDCNRIFTRLNAIPRASNPFCRGCLERRRASGGWIPP